MPNMKDESKTQETLEKIERHSRSISNDMPSVSTIEMEVGEIKELLQEVVKLLKKKS